MLTYVFAGTLVMVALFLAAASGWRGHLPPNPLHTTAHERSEYRASMVLALIACALAFGAGAVI